MTLAIAEPSAADDASEFVPGSTAGELVYAVGDIHGCYRALQAMLTRIAADVTQDPGGRTPILIFCGDYVDRGPSSANVLDALCWLKRHAPYEVHFLKGNHEQVMLDFLVDPVAAADWMRFGGIETFSSYGLQAPADDASPEDYVIARDDLLERLPVSHLRFLQTLELMLTVGDYVFVHAGLRKGRALKDQVVEDMLWIREEFLDVEHRHEKIVVHGHSWVSDRPQLHRHRIGIDTGAYETGVLTAVRLDDGSVSIFSER